MCQQKQIDKIRYIKTVSSVKDVKYNDRTKYNDFVRDRYQTNHINKIILIMIKVNNS